MGTPLTLLALQERHLAHVQEAVALKLADAIAQRRANRRRAEPTPRDPDVLPVPRVSVLVFHAACTLTEGFTVEDLAFVAWQMYGVGMEAFDCPDTHRCRGLMDGKHGLVGRGLLVRLSRGRYRVIGDTQPAA